MTTVTVTFGKLQQKDIITYQTDLKTTKEICDEAISIAKDCGYIPHKWYNPTTWNNWLYIYEGEFAAMIYKE